MKTSSPKNQFNFFLKTNIYFGEKLFSEIGPLLPGNCSRALIVTGRNSARQNGSLDCLQNQLRRLGITPFNIGVSPNPTVDEVDATAMLCRAEAVELVIGLGGGSALDAAKTAAALACTDLSAAQLLAEKGVPARRLPLVQIPTTAGSGSETSMGAVLTDTGRGVKAGIRGEVLLADVAVVDPALTYKLPRHLTMETGFDVLAHAMETFLSVKSNPLSEVFSVETIKKVFRYLPMLAKDSPNPVARREMSLASLMMGINLANSSTCLPHRLQYPVGALTGSGHGLGVAALYPAWLKFVEVHNGEKLDHLGRLLGFSGGKALVRRVNSLLHTTGLRVKLGQLGVDRSMVTLLRERITESLDNDPIASFPGVIEMIYHDSW